MFGVDIADYIILAVLVFSAFDGYRTGFAAQLVRLFGTVIAYVAAWQLHGLLTPAIEGFVHRTLLNGAHSVQNAPLLRLFGGASTVSDATAAISGVISFAIVFYVSLILIRYVGHLLNAVMSLPVLSLINRMAGLTAGVVVAFLLIAVLINVALFLPYAPVRQQVHRSALAPMFQTPVRELQKLEGNLPHVSIRGANGVQGG